MSKDPAANHIELTQVGLNRQSSPSQDYSDKEDSVSLFSS